MALNYYSPVNGELLKEQTNGLFKEETTNTLYLKTKDNKLVPLKSPINNSPLIPTSSKELFFSSIDGMYYNVSSEGLIKPLPDNYSNGSLILNDDSKTFTSYNNGQKYIYDDINKAIIPQYIPDETNEPAHFENGFLVGNETGREYAISPDGQVLVNNDLSKNNDELKLDEEMQQKIKDGDIEKGNVDLQTDQLTERLIIEKLIEGSKETNIALKEYLVSIELSDEVLDYLAGTKGNPGLDSVSQSVFAELIETLNKSLGNNDDAYIINGKSFSKKRVERNLAKLLASDFEMSPEELLLIALIYDAQLGSLEEIKAVATELQAKLRAGEDYPSMIPVDVMAELTPEDNDLNNEVLEAAILSDALAPEEELNVTPEKTLVPEEELTESLPQELEEQDPYKKYLDEMALSYLAAKGETDIIHSQFNIIDGENPECHHSLVMIKDGEKIILQEQVFPYNEEFIRRLLEPAVNDYAQRSPVVSSEVKAHQDEMNPDAQTSDYVVSSVNNNVLSINNVNSEYASTIAGAVQHIEPVLYNEQIAKDEVMGMAIKSEMEKPKVLSYNNLPKPKHVISGFANILVISLIIGFFSGLIIFLAIFLFK